MSRVVIIAVGSRGDVAPLTGVGVALQQAGHEVTIAAYTPFADMITGCGLGFRELPAELQTAADGAEVSPMKGLAAFASPKGMRTLGNDILTALADVPMDVVLLSPFAEMVGHPLSRSQRRSLAWSSASTAVSHGAVSTCRPWRLVGRGVRQPGRRQRGGASG